MNYQKLVKQYHSTAKIVKYYGWFTVYSDKTCGLILSKDCLSEIEAWEDAYNTIMTVQNKQKTCNCNSACKCKNPKIKCNTKKTYTEIELYEILKKLVDFALEYDPSITNKKLNAIRENPKDFLKRHIK